MYWKRLPPTRHPLERRMEALDRGEVAQFSARQWADFLRDSYFPWKYTVPHRLASCLHWFDVQRAEESDEALLRFRDRLLHEDPHRISTSLHTATQVKGMVQADMAVVMAGPFAERQFADEPQREHVGTVGDFVQAQGMADELLAAPEPEVFAAAEAVAREVVADYWPAICAVAVALLDQKSLTGVAVRKIVQQASTGA